MRFDLPLSAIVPQMTEAKILRVLAAEGAVLRVGAPLVEFEVDLSSQFTHDCPPVSFYRIVLREAACLRQMPVAPGQLIAVGQPLAVFSQTADEPLEAVATRNLRVNAVGIIPRWDDMA
jgi:pyruvate/2-oxoglutarate dehydrogenase complex dihydrolipoamide acyltransferase (E2) component